MEHINNTVSDVLKQHETAQCGCEERNVSLRKAKERLTFHGRAKSRRDANQRLTLQNNIKTIQYEENIHNINAANGFRCNRRCATREQISFFAAQNRVEPVEAHRAFRLQL